jgi:hypothetical protein
MTRLSRRGFLKGSAAAAVGAGLGMLPSFARAGAIWGAIPEDLGLSKYRVLDLYLPGGFSQWETFWVSRDDAGELNWRGLGDYVSNLEWLPGPDAPGHSLETKLFAAATAARPEVHWGPATKPLWRDDIFERARMVLTRHGHEVHGLSAHLNQTGRDLGRPRAAGVGAAIQRHFQSLPGALEIPYAYAFEPADPSPGREYFMTHALMNGPHPGPARPLGLRVGAAIEDLLTRNGVSAEADAVFGALREQYRDLLRFKGQGAPVRSAGFAAHDGAAQYLVNAHLLDGLLGGNELDADPVVPPTASDAGAVNNPTTRSLELAAKMFAHGARHVTVIDGSFDESQLRDTSGMPYDCHHRPGARNLVEVTSVGVFQALHALAKIVAPPSQSMQILQKAIGPGYTIDLDQTLIRIFTEFGRRPDPTKQEPISSGRDHFAAANLMILIGGPVTKRGIQGSITTSGTATSAESYEALSPTDVHAAMLLAAGVDPFASDNFTSGDDFSEVVLANGASPGALRALLKEKVLGATPFGFKAQL